MFSTLLISRARSWRRSTYPQIASGSSDAITTNAAIFVRSGQSENRNHIVIRCPHAPASEARQVRYRASRRQPVNERRDARGEPRIAALNDRLNCQLLQGGARRAA